MFDVETILKWTQVLGFPIMATYGVSVFAARIIERVFDRSDKQYDDHRKDMVRLHENNGKALKDFSDNLQQMVERFSMSFQIIIDEHRTEIKKRDKEFLDSQAFMSQNFNKTNLTLEEIKNIQNKIYRKVTSSKE